MLCPRKDAVLRTWRENQWRKAETGSWRRRRGGEGRGGMCTAALWTNEGFSVLCWKAAVRYVSPAPYIFMCLQGGSSRHKIHWTQEEASFLALSHTTLPSLTVFYTTPQTVTSGAAGGLDSQQFSQHNNSSGRDARVKCALQPVAFIFGLMLMLPAITFPGLCCPPTTNDSTSNVTRLKRLLEVDACLVCSASSV